MVFIYENQYIAHIITPERRQDEKVYLPPRVEEKDRMSQHVQYYNLVTSPRNVFMKHWPLIQEQEYSLESDIYRSQNLPPGFILRVGVHCDAVICSRKAN